MAVRPGGTFFGRTGNQTKCVLSKLTAREMAPEIKLRHLKPPRRLFNYSLVTCGGMIGAVLAKLVKQQ